MPDLHIESSLMWRSKPSPLRTWLRRWKRDSWFRHLSGRILKPCQHRAFESELTYSLAVIPVSPLAQQDYAEAQTTLDTSGPTYGDTLNQLDLFGASLKTSRAISASDSEKSSKTWKALVTQRRGEYSARLKLARRTSEKGSISWATPCARDHHPNGMKDGSKVDLGNQVRMWPTPTAQDNNQVKGDPDHPKRGTTLGGAVRQWPTPRTTDTQQGRGVVEINGKLYRPSKALSEGKLVGGANLADAAQMWPTPAARDWKDTPGMASEAVNKDGSTRNRTDQLARAIYNSDQRQSAGQLNPTWVEWLMGLPLGWTDLGSWGME